MRQLGTISTGIDLDTRDMSTAMSEDILKALGAEVRRARKLNGLNQTDAAVLINQRTGLDLSQTRLSQIERGQSRDVLMYQGILLALGRTLEFTVGVRPGYAPTDK